MCISVIVNNFHCLILFLFYAFNQINLLTKQTVEELCYIHSFIHINDLNSYYGLGTVLYIEHEIPCKTKSLFQLERLVSKYLTYYFPFSWGGRGEPENQKLVKMKTKSPEIWTVYCLIGSCFKTGLLSPLPACWLQPFCCITKITVSTLPCPTEWQTWPS